MKELSQNLHPYGVNTERILTEDLVDLVNLTR